MIRRPEDLSQKEPNPLEGEIKEDRNPDGVNSDSLALGVRDWTKTGRHGKIFLDRPYPNIGCSAT
jgi:hypothetical protein